MTSTIPLKTYHHQGAKIIVGLDPSEKILTSWGLPVSANGLEIFCAQCVEALTLVPAIVKFQAAFFERFGSQGVHHLETATRQFRDSGIPVILDAKRGDIGSTVEAYANAYIGNADFPLSGLTVNPYLGFDALKPFFERALAHEFTLFVVARSSNPEGDLLQTAVTNNGESVAAHICDSIAALNEAYGAPIAGAVLGATQPQTFADLARRLDGAPILAPGIGAQGATLKELQEMAGSYYRQTIPAASRAILKHGDTAQNMARAIDAMSAEDRNLRTSS
ncbi:MAG: orotidine-5'-phosphate decarboxylase [Parvularculales bacterium]